MNDATRISPTFSCRLISGLLACIALASSPAQVCLAQSGEDIAKGLLRALIESQLETSRRRNDNSPTQLNRRPQPTTAQIQTLRPITASFAQEAITLGALVQSESRRNFELRPRVPDVLRFQAQAAALKQRVAAQSNHALLIDDFRTINNDWGVLAHQLQQCRNLSPQVNACVNRLTTLNTQFCSLLEIQARYDDAELTRIAYMLTTYVHDLIDDVQHTSNSRATSRQLLRTLGRFSQQADSFAGLVSGTAQYETIVADYQLLFKSWTTLETELAGFSDYGTTRTIRRIRDTHESLHELLRLEKQIDKTHILNLIHDADHQLNELFRSITLEQLMVLHDGGAVPAAADALSGTIQNIDDLVHRDQNQQVIGEAWVYVDDAWNRFSFFMNPTNNPGTNARLSSLDQTLGALQRALGVIIQYDRRALVKSAVTLEQLSDQLSTGLKRWQARAGQHDRTLQAKAAELVQLFHRIEQSIAAGQGGERNLRECDEAIVLWQQIRPALETCDTTDRTQFDHISVAMTEEMIRLRTMLDNS